MSSIVRPFPYLSFYFLTCCSAVDVEVSCAREQSCVLPCFFTAGDDPYIHWTKQPEIPVHIFYKGKHRVNVQNKTFTGRTDLSDVGKGNASLLLEDVRVSDAGKYKCEAQAVNNNVTKTSVNVHVYAPVGDVSLVADGQSLTCSSKDIFPKPSVSWSSLSDVVTSVTPSETGLFSVNSSVPQRPPEDYRCNISTDYSWKSATYRKKSELFADSVSVACTEPKAPVKSLVWKFNHRQTILTKTGPEPVYSESWRRFVDRLTESNSLVLKDLSQDQLGLFSCELSTESEEFIINTQLFQPEATRHHGVVTAVIIILLMLLVIAIVFFILRFKARKARMNAVRCSEAEEPDGWT